MGMFDYLRCEMPLPDSDDYTAAGGDGVFQTKSLNCVMEDVTIKVDGTIHMPSGNLGADHYTHSVYMKPESGHVLFYDWFKRVSYTWRARVESGKVVSIERWDKSRRRPMEPNDTDESDEQAHPSRHFPPGNPSIIGAESGPIRGR